MAKKDKKGCAHRWRKTAETHTHWFGLGWGIQRFRACFECSKIEWLDFTEKEK